MKPELLFSSNIIEWFTLSISFGNLGRFKPGNLFIVSIYLMEILNEVCNNRAFCRKPCCEYEMLNFTDEIILSQINFSNNFEITVCRLISRQFETSFLSRFLKIGTVSLNFHVDGKTHLIAIVLKSRYRDLEIEQFSFFKRMFPGLSSTLALLLSKFSKKISISVVVKWRFAILHSRDGLFSPT